MSVSVTPFPSKHTQERDTKRVIIVDHRPKARTTGFSEAPMRIAWGCLSVLVVATYVIVMGVLFFSYEKSCQLSSAGDFLSLADSLSPSIESHRTKKQSVAISDISQADVFQSAWYIDDKPISVEEFNTDYAHEFRHLQKNPDFIPYKPKIEKNKGKPSISGLGNDQVLSTLRPLNLELMTAFNPICHQYRFNLTVFPSVSVIMPVQNERPGLVAFTVHSILGRTPPALLKEIIIVDDNFDAVEAIPREEVAHLKSLSHKIVFIRNSKPLGCAGSRLVAARRASGEVLVVVDSHGE